MDFIPVKQLVPLFFQELDGLKQDRKLKEKPLAA